MTRGRLAIAAVVVAALAWWLVGAHGGGDAGAQAGGSAQQLGVRSIDPAFAQQLSAIGRNRSGHIDLRSAVPIGAGDGNVSISGKVIDRDAKKGVGNVEVVFRNELGESSATSGSDGSYSITVAAGTYHAFVRDDDALSVGFEDHVRLPAPPSSDAAGVPDEGLLPAVVAVTDVEHVDLPVVFGGRVEGRVVDSGGHPVAGAVLRARGDVMRPALGTDIAESDAQGRFDMRLPTGDYALEVAHERLAGLSAQVQFAVERGDVAHPTVTLTAGCVITGKVIAADGKPAGDGALERRFGDGEDDFAPAGRIETDGTFRWVTSETAQITLRAWPWKSPPAPAQAFACRDGARYANVVYRLPAEGPAMAGTLVDANGEPVALGFIDIAAMDGGFGQQERTDAQGHWAVYHMKPGGYRITATAPGRGVLHADVSAPSTNVTLRLGGTGTLSGTAAGIADGSFELTLLACNDDKEGDSAIGLSHAPRLVTVHDHNFTVEDVPACALMALASWQGDQVPVHADVPAGGVGTVALELGPPRPLRVHGVVYGAQGAPMPHVDVTASGRGDRIEARTDAQGAYTMEAAHGDQLFAVTYTDDGAKIGYASEKLPIDGADDQVYDLHLTFQDASGMEE